MYVSGCVLRQNKEALKNAVKDIKSFAAWRKASQFRCHFEQAGNLGMKMMERQRRKIS
jgi:hypothetical protein